MRLAREYLSEENGSGGAGDRVLAYLAMREDGEEQALVELNAAVTKIEAEEIDAGWWAIGQHQVQLSRRSRARAAEVRRSAEPNCWTLSRAGTTRVR